MKYADCNERQKKAFRNIAHAASWIIGGLENTLLDYGEETAEYKSAKAKLANHSGLVNEIYAAATTDIYTGDGVFFGAAAESCLKDIRFCGKEWLMERCEKRVTKLGY